MRKHIFKTFDSETIVAAFIILTALILASCAKNALREAKYAPNETDKNMEAHFCPREDCGSSLAEKIMSANSSVYCAFYDLNLDNVIKALAKRSNDIDVKLVMDESNYKEQAKGDGIKLDIERHLMHDKFCVIDDEIVTTGSFNPTFNDNMRNNNNIIIVYSKALAKNYGDEFNELWDGKFGSGNKVENPAIYVNGIKIENYFCPEDSCESRIAPLIKGAKQSIYFMAFSFTSQKIADEIMKKENLEVRGIFDSQQTSNSYSQYKRMKDFKVNVKKDSNKYKMHHKVFIIDNETVVTGSTNPTYSGFESNDENIIIIHDANFTKKFMEEFDLLWN